MTGWVGRRGLFHVGAAASTRSLVVEAEAAGCQVYVVSSIDSKDALLDALAGQLRFPHWTGHNWDATADVLSDLAWLPPGPVTLIWADPESLAEADPAAYRMAVELLTYAARSVRSRDLTVLLAHRGPY
ncbi:MAG: barstar family protein [Geodermatophilaceae bacterium]